MQNPTGARVTTVTRQIYDRTAEPLAASVPNIMLDLHQQLTSDGKRIYRYSYIHVVLHPLRSD